MAAEPDVTIDIRPPGAGATEDAWRTWADGLVWSRTLGLRCVDMSPGSVVIEIEDIAWPLNPNGSVHGGFLAAAADHALGIVAATAYPGRVPSTATLSAQYHRPARLPLLLRATVSHEGRSLAFVSVDIEDGQGHVCMHCHGTMAMIEPDSHMAR